MLRARVLSRASLLLLPALAWQGQRVRARTPRLPEADGPRHGEAPGVGPPLRVLFLGESPVAGVGLASHDEGVGGSFARAWRAHTGQGARWRAHGRTGFTAEMTRTILLPELDERAWDLLVIGLGVNDTLSLTRTAVYAADLRALIDAARETIGPVPVVLSGLPPVHGFPALPSPLREVAGLRARLLDQVSARVADTTPRCAFAPLTTPPAPHLFAEDGFHPGPLGHVAWADALLSTALPLLAPPDSEPSAARR